VTEQGSGGNAPPATETAVGLRRTVIRGGALAATGLLVSQAISFFSFVILARLAPPSTFGAYAAASILIGASALFVEAGMQAAVVQRQDEVEKAASTAFVANLLGGVALSAIAAAFAPLIGLFFHDGDITTASAILAGVILVNAASIVPGALLQREVSFRFTFLGPLTSVVYGVAAVAALAAGLGLWGLVLATYAAAVARTTAVLALSRWRPSMSLLSWQMWLSLSRYGRPVVLSSLLREVGLAGSTAIVGRALGTASLGQFRFAQRVVVQVNSAIVFGSAYALLPAFSRIWRDDVRFRASVRRALHTLSVIVFPISLVFIPLGRPFATIVLGDDWTGAGPILMAMSGVGIALAVDSICSEAFKATERTDLLPRMHGLTALLPIGLMFAFLPLGAVGMGLALSLGMGAVAGYALAALSRVTQTPFRDIVAEIVPATACSGLMAGSIYVLDRFVVRSAERGGTTGLVLLLGEVVTAAAIYLLALFSLAPRSFSEFRSVLLSLIGRDKAIAATVLESKTG
jgi:O-antigen/teichoic acid export membrane protein